MQHSTTDMERYPLREVLNRMFAFVGLYTPDGVLIEVNDVPLEAASLSRADVIGKPYWDTYWWTHSTDTQIQVKDTLRRAAEGETVRDFFQVRLADQRYIIIDAMFSPLHDENGRVSGIVGSGFDVSEQIIAKRRLREQESLIASYFEYSPQILAVKDTIGRWVRANRTFYKITGLNEQDVIGKTSIEFSAPEAAIPGINADQLVLEEGTAIEKIIPVETVSGFRDFLEIKFPIRDESGAITQIGIVGTDISEHRETAARLRKNENLVSGILSISEEAVIIADDDFHISLYSRGAERIFGYTREEAAGMSITQLIPERLRAGHENLIRQFRDSSESSLRMEQRANLIGLRADGGEFPAAVSVSKFRDDDRFLYVIILRDIGPELLVVDELMAAKLAAESSSQAKSSFLATMSHELRTPLNAVIGFSDLIYDQTAGPVGNEQYLEYAKAINDSGKQLLSIISNVLDFSSVEADRLELVETVIDVGAAVLACRESVMKEAKSKDIKLTLDVEKQLPPLRADEKRFRQILLNLLSNAIKFTPSGGEVEVKVWARREAGLVFQIRDTGIGMSLDEIATALTPFTQVDREHTRRYEGIGIGLPLTKLFVELHSGSLDLQSELGGGTTVTVRFPAERVLFGKGRIRT